MNRYERVSAFAASLGTADILDWMLRAGAAVLTGFAVSTTTCCGGTSTARMLPKLASVPLAITQAH